MQNKIIKCFICEKFFENAKNLMSHLHKAHKIRIKEYKLKYNLFRRCLKCNKIVSKHCKGYFCNKCRNRDGKNNAFFGKTHSVKTINIIKNKTAIASTLLWQNNDYRNKVIKGISKPRNESFKKEQSKRIKKWYIDNPIQREIRRKSMKENWEKGIITKNNYSSNTSKIENEFYEEIKKIDSSAEHKKTLQISDNGYLFPDIIIEKLGLIIEFFGNYWHANPKIYKAEDIIHHKLKASQIWENDEKRIKKFEHIILKDKKFAIGYNVFIIWEDDYIKNKEMILKNLNGLIDLDSCAF